VAASVRPRSWYWTIGILGTVLDNDEISEDRLLELPAAVSPAIALTPEERLE